MLGVYMCACSLKTKDSVTRQLLWRAGTAHKVLPLLPPIPGLGTAGSGLAGRHQTPGDDGCPAGFQWPT